jgi:son of sevenless
MGTPDEIFDLLLSQYNQAQPQGLTGSEADDWRVRRLYPIQHRVLAVFQTWLVDHRMVEDDPPIARRLQMFLAEVTAAKENADVAAEVGKSLEHMVCALLSLQTFVVH